VSHFALLMSLIHQGTEAVDIHLILAWTTRSRIPILKNETAVSVRTAVREVCAVFEVKIIEGLVAEDYIRIRVQCPSSVAIHGLAEMLKTRSDEIIAGMLPELHGRFGGRSIWSGGYFCMSVDGGIDFQDYFRNQSTANEEAISIPGVD
jgi:REP element-mobilizing transposase RayT